MKKTIVITCLIIVGILIIFLSINLYGRSKCGDNICQRWEEKRGSCIEDCKKNIIENYGESNISNLQTSACKVKSVGQK